MRSLARAFLLLFLFFSISFCVPAQSSKKGGTAVITGRVTAGGKPLPNILVMLMPGDPGFERNVVARATTDFEGSYRLTGVPAGRFNIAPITPTMVGPIDPGYGRLGRPIIVDEGETIEKVDFTLTPGGVITGRITDPDGKPAIEERVQVELADNSPRRTSFYGSLSNPYMFMTDDRGVYRIYGIAPGKYTVSAGVSPQEAFMSGGRRRSYYERIYYPGETDVKNAAVIEVTEGGEVKDVDIKLERRAQTFAASGRLADAETGKPVPNVRVGYGPYSPNERRVNGYAGFSYNLTDANGQFKIEGIAPGSFAAFILSDSDGYSEPVPFEITDSDVGGLEIKMRRGATLSGTVQLEGTNDKSVLARLQKLSISAYVQSEKIASPEMRPAPINADGSFRVTGLSPGKATLYISGYPQQKDLKIARLELGGVAQPTGIDIKPGADVTNVRVVIEYGGGSIRGLVRVENGELPEGANMAVLITKSNGEQNPRPLDSVMIDARGRFLIEGLATGDYQLVLQVRSPIAPSRGRLSTVKQNVNVTSGAQTEVTLVLDLAAAEGKEQ